MCSAPGATSTSATGGGSTVTAAFPDLPSLVAVTIADPATIPVTRPSAFTLATAGLPELQSMCRPARTFPSVERSVAPSCRVSPSMTVAASGVTETDATGTASGSVDPPDSCVRHALPSNTAASVQTPKDRLGRDPAMAAHRDVSRRRNDEGTTPATVTGC